MTANLGTLGVATAMRKKCGVCGHPLTAHTGQVVAVTNQQPAAPIIIAQALAPPHWPSQMAQQPPRFPDAIEAPSQQGPGASAPTVPPEPVSVADELKKLAGLRDAGVLTEREFADQKARLLA